MIINREIVFRKSNKVNLLFCFVLFFSACVSKQPLTHNDFYSKRIVKNQKPVGFSNHAKPFVAGIARLTIRQKPAETQVREIPGLQEETADSLPITTNRLPVVPRVDIASLDNSLFVDPVHERLREKIGDLYRTENDIRSFNKGYREIKRQRIREFKKWCGTDDPVTTDTPRDTRPGLSILSFTVGVAGLFIFGIICGIFAICLGGIGIQRGFKGLAIAGMLLGIIDIIAVTFALGAL